MTRVEWPPELRIMLVAGEASGDLHGAALCRALKTQAPGAHLFGMGGSRMATAGMQLLADIGDTAIVGISEVVRRLPALRRTYRRLGSAILSERPAVLVLIDYPGMNLRLAATARAAGVPVVYFIPPQIWAWRPGRVKTIRRHVALVLAVFPFERALYRSAGVAAEFVGHPVLDALAAAPERSAARRELGVEEDTLLIGLLPGSRRQEIERMTPLMRDAAARIAAVHSRARFVLGLAPTVDRRAVEEHLDARPPIEVVADRTYAVMRAADLLLVTSGTATLEAALLGTPMVVCYRVSLLSELIGRLVVRVPWISLANIVLGRAVVPELYQRRDATADRVAREALALLDTPGALEAQRQAFGELSDRLGRPGVGERAARLVLAVAGARA
ncbi:MAG: lipid-A-disaccharide synthase [Candidatus Rokubacteria bacterium 13_1_40CM_69_27]|nr:MAG: lipid-A-disaccharide synthase [Candidatus Rokubacteria bacterium 13_1_40CM_69_27]OLC33586.1 MAG: lipid-A-disaccharide synthase [Candidatus Rokubacteria bacterium 13_1_40CM_4_69_5]